MIELIRPNSSVGQGTPVGYEKISIPESAKDLKYIQQLIKENEGAISRTVDYEYQLFSSIQKKQQDLEQTIENYRNEVVRLSEESKSQSNRNIEVIGIFSSVIALLIIHVGIISSADTFLKAILLSVSTTCTISIFAILIHSFFSNNCIKISKLIITPLVILAALLLIGICAEVFDWRAINNISINVNYGNSTQQ